MNSKTLQEAIAQAQTPNELRTVTRAALTGRQAVALTPAAQQALREALGRCTSAAQQAALMARMQTADGIKALLGVQEAQPVETVEEQAIRQTMQALVELKNLVESHGRVS